MPDPVIRDVPSSSRMMDALISVSEAVTQSIIQTALQTHTPVIVQDEHGQIVRLDPKELAKRHGLEV